MTERKFITQYLHFDSVDALFTKDITNGASSVQNSYKSIFPMNQTFRNIKRVYLISAELPAAISSDGYLFMYIPTLNGVNASQTGQSSTFKITTERFSTNSNAMYYLSEANSFQQFVDITDSRLTISSLSVFLIDRYGTKLNSGGHDYSFTLALELYV
jgi:hypothetical protein